MMKFKIVMILIIIVVSNNILFGQKSSVRFEISGNIADEISCKGLIKASVSILKRNDNKSIAGVITDEKGNFSTSNLTEPNVRIKISMMGYQTVVLDSVDLTQTTRLGLIKLKPTTIVMPDIIITSLKPMIEFHADRRIINMDRLPGNTGSVMEALQNSGLVQIDFQTSRITVRGQDVKIQIDGHESNMPSEMLNQFPAIMIDQAEVIIAPGAKESAEGGTYILNLISKKNKKDNYSGLINYITSSNKRNQVGLYLGYKVSNINLFGQISGIYGERNSESEMERYNYASNYMYYQKSKAEDESYRSFGYFKLGMDYDINEKNSITLYGMFNKEKNIYNHRSINSIKDNQKIFQFGYTDNSLNNRTNDILTISGFYKRKYQTKGNELTFDIYFTSFKNPSNDKMILDYSNKFGLPQKQNNSTSVNAQTLILRTDYSLPIRPYRIEAGYNFTFRNRNNDYEVMDYSYLSYNWKDSLGLSNMFTYKEYINAIYATLSYKIGKFDIKGGLRTENLNTHGNQQTTGAIFSNNFLSIFPNINISYSFNDLFNIGINTFRRVTYPQVGYINPFRKYTGPNTFSEGNPSINPFYVSSYAINLSDYVNVYYTYSTGDYTQAVSVENDSVLVSSYINLNNSKIFGLDLILPYYDSPNMPFHLPSFINMLNFQFSYSSKKQNGQFLRENLSMTENSYLITASLGVNLWYGINASVYYYYKPRTNNRISSAGTYKDLSIYLSKTIMDNKLRMSLSIYDPFKWQKSDYKYYGLNYYISGNSMSNSSRNIALGITYMFNDYKERRERRVDDGRDSSVD